MTVDTQRLRDQATDAVAEALGDAYDCTRVWSAWGYGTMSSDDFCLVTDDESRLAEITEAALNPAIAVINAQAAEIDQLREKLQGASNYIDTLGGVSKGYRAALSGEPT